jgi:membrane associated rhomboid family serine protease
VFKEEEGKDGQKGIMIPQALATPPQEADVARIKKLLMGDLRQGLLYCGFICILLFVNIPGVMLTRDNKMLAILLLFLFGIAPAINAGFQWLEYARRRTQEQRESRRTDEVLFSIWISGFPRWPAYVAVGVLVVMFLIQVFHAGMISSLGGYMQALGNSYQEAGLYRLKVTMDDQWWRIITAGLLHGGMIHLFFNSKALLSISSVLHGLCRTSWIVIVFTLSVVGGSLASVYGPVRFGPSVGASGGIMGLLGFLLVLSYFYKGGLPHFIKGSVVTSVFLIGILGWLGKDFIDNAAHGGGFVVGVALGGIVALFDDLLLGKEKTPVYTYAAAGICGAVLLFGAVKVLLVLS